MKLKKKHFKILKEIAEKLNHELNYSGLLLSDLIADIKSVQNVKDTGVAFMENDNTEPKIGDVGYFNLGSPNTPVIYGRMRNSTGNIYQDTHGNWYVGFSKTPPELR